jgi:hypothetical protein
MRASKLGDFDEMPANPPLMASGSRDPQRQRPLPAKVKAMVTFMVRGSPTDENAAPLDFIAAGRLAGLSPDVARRWLDRTAFRVALRAERRAFREAICAGNEKALARIRDAGGNAMASVRAVQTLEAIDEEAVRSDRGVSRAPGMVIQIVTAPPGPTPVTIDHKAHVPRTVLPLADRNS